MPSLHRASTDALIMEENIGSHSQQHNIHTKCNTTGTLLHVGTTYWSNIMCSVQETVYSPSQECGIQTLLLMDEPDKSCSKQYSL